MKKGKYYKKELGRREFFKKAFAAGAVAALTPSILASEAPQEIAKAAKPKAIKAPKLSPLEGTSILKRFDPDIGWTDIGYVNAIDLSAPPPIEVTSLSEPSGYREFIANYNRSTKIIVDVAFSKHTYEILASDFYDDSSKDYAIAIDQTSLEFEGYVTEMPLIASEKNMVGCEITMEITGACTLNSL